MTSIPVSGNGQRGTTLDNGSTTVRQSPRTDFGTQVRNGVAAGGGAAAGAIGVAAPFVPGGAVVAAAVSGAAGGLGGLGGGGGGGGYAGAGAGQAGAPAGTQFGPDGIPVGGSFLSGGGGGAGGTGGAAGSGSQQDLLNQTKGMQEMAQSFNLQYLQLQEKMQSENRSFSTVSNVMKTKHDTAKSSISNVR